MTSPRQRPSARLLVVDPGGHVLLFRFVVPDGPLAGQEHWGTPGGGLDPGESYEQAALRELREEVGIVPARLSPPVARRQVIFPLNDGTLVEADERYFRVEVADRRLSQAGWSEEEQRVIAEHRWWSPAALATTQAQVWPENLAAMLTGGDAPLTVEPAVSGFATEAAAADFSFHVNCEAMPPFAGPGLGALAATKPWRKTLPLDLAGHEAALTDPQRAVYVARRAGRFQGFVAMAHHWNGYALLRDLAVERKARHGGVARALMDRAVAWARAQGLAGITLETQSNNVPACRFYERYGFTLGGADAWLYRALHPGTREVALFWYLPLS